MSLAAIILAAGKATRMKSHASKSSTKSAVAPCSLMSWTPAAPVGVTKLFLVIGHDRQRVIDTYKNDTDITWVIQEEQKGTGHAVQVCEPAMKSANVLNPDDHVFVLGGDGPLIRGETLQALADKAPKHCRCRDPRHPPPLDNPLKYVRLRAISRDAFGNVVGIVEQNDATPEQRPPPQPNPTYWMFGTRDLFESNRLRSSTLTIRKANITSLIPSPSSKTWANASKPSPPSPPKMSSPSIPAANWPMSPASCKSGVTLVSPENTWIEFGATIGQDTVIEPFTWIGRGAIDAGLHIAAGSVIPAGTV